jgi:hypothetical protein
MEQNARYRQLDSRPAHDFVNHFASWAHEEPTGNYPICAIRIVDVCLVSLLRPKHLRSDVQRCSRPAKEPDEDGLLIEERNLQRGNSIGCLTGKARQFL